MEGEDPLSVVDSHYCGNGPTEESRERTSVLSIKEDLRWFDVCACLFEAARSCDFD
jgi:hypothetical protein